MDSFERIFNSSAVFEALLALLILSRSWGTDSAATIHGHKHKNLTGNIKDVYQEPKKAQYLPMPRSTLKLLMDVF